VYGCDPGGSSVAVGQHRVGHGSLLTDPT